MHVLLKDPSQIQQSYNLDLESIEVYIKNSFQVKACSIIHESTVEDKIVVRRDWNRLALKQNGGQIHMMLKEMHIVWIEQAQGSCR